MTGVFFLAAAASLTSSVSACTKKYSRRWPHCDNLRCVTSNWNLNNFKAMCAADDKCDGFSFTAGSFGIKGGCLKYDCKDGREGRRGYGHGSHDYYECKNSAFIQHPNPLGLAVAARYNQADTPAWNRMLSLSNYRDCYVFSIDAGTFERHMMGIVKPEVGGYICDDVNGRITNGEFGYTLGGCFDFVGKSASIVNGKFRMQLLDVSADVCTLLSFGVGKAITAMAKKMIGKSVAYGVKRSGSSWAQRKYATMNQYGKLPSSSWKSWAARNAGDYLYGAALHQATAPVRPPVGDCQAMYNAVMKIHEIRFCMIRKVAAATGNHALQVTVREIDRFVGTLREALRFIPIEQLIPPSNVGVKLDMSIDVNTFLTTLYFGFHVELAMFSQQKAAAAISSRLGESCRSVSRTVCSQVRHNWGPFNWAKSGFKWVCRVVSDVVCTPFQVTPQILKKIPDITDYMPKFKYRLDNLSILSVNMGRAGVLNFMRMPSRRDLTRRRRLSSRDEENEDLGEDSEDFMDGFEAVDLGDENAIIDNILETDGNGILSRIFDSEDGGSDSDDMGYNSTFHNSTNRISDTEDDIHRYGEFRNTSGKTSDLDIDAEINEICGMKTTFGECEKMATECFWSDSDGCSPLVDEDSEVDDDELIEKESRKILDSGKRHRVNDPTDISEKKGKRRGRKHGKREKRAAEVDRRQFDKKLKHLGRALRRANCNLEFGFLGGASDVWTNEKYAAPGTSGEGIISQEMGDMVDAVIELLGRWKIKGSTKCGRLERLGAKLAEAHDGLFELHVGGLDKDEKDLKKRGNYEIVGDAVTGDYAASGDNEQQDVFDRSSEDDNNLRRRLEDGSFPSAGIFHFQSPPAGAMVDVRLYECSVQWAVISPAFKELCRQRFAALQL